MTIKYAYQLGSKFEGIEIGRKYVYMFNECGTYKKLLKEIYKHKYQGRTWYDICGNLGAYPDLD